MKKIVLILFLVCLLPITTFSQSDDYYSFMGAERNKIIDLFNEFDRIYTGNYSEVVYDINDDTVFWFFFDDNDKCNSFTIKKKTQYYEDIVLLLNSQFPNKITEKTDLFWNSRMMVSIVKEKEIINISFRRVDPSLLNRK